jgi:hypothetical protein
MYEGHADCRLCGVDVVQQEDGSWVHVANDPANDWSYVEPAITSPHEAEPVIGWCDDCSRDIYPDEKVSDHYHQYRPERKEA